jgi:hypothetical protein
MGVLGSVQGKSLRNRKEGMNMSWGFLVSSGVLTNIRIIHVASDGLASRGYESESDPNHTLSSICGWWEPCRRLGM